ncbi:diacylglycerol/lipid kinase family protein [Bifidobacterium platyrrhinorum]|uniref:Diacylglycerol kinase n=1 Tax=Bifidobacterium platyrrhinorum TaxID=2661628 RepID=A0A6L9SRY7_9BIFI|nr:diacylglycerol kinase family protein [Bifidobacterium platyrrhinorum]NEG55337.1 diacylglycerol kinase [Bifidobacterium platyrrhinorum]
MTESKDYGVVAVIGNPLSDKGKGARIGERVLGLLTEAGERHGFGVTDLTGDSFDGSLANAREHMDDYDHLVVIGGDGMIALGANAVGASGKPLGIVATGSGNDFARGLKLPVNRVDTAVEGIVGAIVRGSHIDVDMGHVTALPGAVAVDPTTGAETSTGAEASTGVEPGERMAAGAGTKPYAVSSVPAFDRFYAGMLSCGLDASINDRANHSRLPGGSLRYFAAVLVEVSRLKRYGYHIKATLADGTTEEHDIISPMLTVANSRHIGGGLEVSPYSRFDDGLLDLIWIDHMPNAAEIADAISKGYNGKLLASKVFGWKRVRDIEITRAVEGEEPPVLMADGEYIGRLPVTVRACDRALRVLVPPAVARLQEHEHGEDRVLAMLERDGRNPVTGEFLGTREK